MGRKKAEPVVPAIEGDGEAIQGFAYEHHDVAPGPVLLGRWSAPAEAKTYKSFSTHKAERARITYRDSTTCPYQQPLHIVATAFESNDVEYTGGVVLRLQVLGGEPKESRVQENPYPVAKNIENGVEIHFANVALANAVEAALRKLFARRAEPEFFDDD